MSKTSRHHNNHDSDHYRSANMDGSDQQNSDNVDHSVTARANGRDQGTGNRKHSWKKKLIIALLGIVVLSALAVVGLMQRRTYYSNKFLAESWHKVYASTNNVVSSASINDISDTKELNQQWAKLNETLENQKFLLGQINHNLNRAKYFDKYNKLLEDLVNATKTEWSVDLGNREALNQSLGARSVELKSLNDQSSDFAKAYSDILKDERIDLYKVVEKLQEKVKAFYLEEDKKTEDDKAAENLKNEQAQAAAAELLAAKEAVVNFASSLVKNNDTLITQSLSSGYKKEFKKEQYINQSSSISAYRIIDTKKSDNGSYYLVETSLTVTYTDNSSSYPYTQKFRVVKESGRWLVDGPSL